MGTPPENGTLSGTAPNLTYTPNSGYRGADSFTYTANDGVVDSAPATVSITVNEPVSTLHVGNIDGSKENNKNKWRASANFAIHETNHSPVSGAIVSYSWSSREASGSGTCTTDGAGQCPSDWTPYLNKRNKRNESVTFTVGNVDPSAWYWSPDNHDPGGDSDGTTITIVKP